MTNWITRLSTADEQLEFNHKVASLAQSIGFQELNYMALENLSNNYSRRANLIESMTTPVQNEDTVVIQFPLFTHLNFQAEFINRLKNVANVKLVAFITNIPTYENNKEYDKETDFWLSLLRKFDLLICPTSEMVNKLNNDDVSVRKTILIENTEDYSFGVQYALMNIQNIIELNNTL
ncbi:MAG: hypothetical protein FWE43_03240 [Streptococcaceae bacterium]|nr:hypothetical protein [Streptococcaceae bacterium]MCL2681478.1 hypothetical protein [Streptococcaceae bacterium]